MAKRYDASGKPLPIRTPDDLSAETREALAVLRNHATATKQLIDEHRARVAMEYRNENLSSAGKRQNAALHQQAVREQAEALKAQTEQALATIADAHRRARTPQGDSAAQLLAFQQEQDGAARALKMVQSGLPLYKVIQAAGQSGDVAMLNGLKRHIPSELAAQEAGQPGIVAEHLNLIAQVEAPYLSDVEKAIREQEAALPQLQGAIRWNSNVLAHAAEHPYGDPGTPNLIGPDRDMVTVAPEPSGLPRL